MENRSVSIGGNSVSEHFNPVDDFSRMISSIEGPETCNTYNMLRLTMMLYRTSKDKKYVDYYERALYNHILSTQHPHTGGYVYFTQMRPGHFNRKWKKGDRVVMEMEMSLKAEQLPDKSGYYSFSYGPVVLAARTDAEDQTGLFADESRGGHIARGKQIPMKNMPLLVGDPDKLISYLSPVPDKLLTFRLTNLYPEQYAGGVELVPFSTLHESRYIIYWPQATKEEAEKIRFEQEIQEAERLKLYTVSQGRVVCGEQQPESDHFIESDRSTVGIFEDTRWREANGWFSYKLKNNDRKARYLYVEYFDNDRGRNFGILVNDERVKGLSLTGNKGDELQKLIVPIPEDLTRSETLTVTFMAMPGIMPSAVTDIIITR